MRRHVERLSTQMDIPGPLGGLAQAVVLAVFVVTALAQVGVPTQILLVLVSVLLAAAAATLALAFGIGGRQMAREVSARRYVEGSYRVGEEITVADVRGTISAIDATSTVLETAEGDRVRDPELAVDRDGRAPPRRSLIRVTFSEVRFVAVNSVTSATGRD